MNFVEAVKTCLTKYGDSAGRASRSEYWYFYLFTFLVGLVLSVLDIFIVSAFHIDSPFLMKNGILSIIFNIAMLLPSWAAMIRRLHDGNRSGWWFFIVFTVIGIIPFIYWMVKKGTDGYNKYGPDPLMDKNFYNNELAQE